MARSKWDAIDPNSPAMRKLIKAARNGESYEVDWDPTESSWGVIDSRGTFVQHALTREAARAAARNRGAREGL
jgi:hypothetical protein